MFKLVWLFLLLHRPFPSNERGHCTVLLHPIMPLAPHNAAIRTSPQKQKLALTVELMGLPKTQRRKGHLRSDCSRCQHKGGRISGSPRGAAPSLCQVSQGEQPRLAIRERRSVSGASSAPLQCNLPYSSLTPPRFSALSPLQQRHPSQLPGGVVWGRLTSASNTSQRPAPVFFFSPLVSRPSLPLLNPSVSGTCRKCAKRVTPAG